MRLLFDGENIMFYNDLKNSTSCGVLARNLGISHQSSMEETRPTLSFIRTCSNLKPSNSETSSGHSLLLWLQKRKTGVISSNSLYKKDYNFQGAYSIIVIKIKNEKEYEYSWSYMVQHKLTCIYWYNTQFNK